MILKLWCKGTNKRECYNGINAEPLTTQLRKWEVKEVKEVHAHHMIPYGPTDGHPLNNQWASTEQALGTHCQCGGQRIPK